MPKPIDSLPTRSITRRRFVQDGAFAATLLAGASSLGACSSGTLTQGAAAPEEVAPVWISAACWDNCGGRCVNRVLMQDGTVVRQSTDTSHEDSYEWVQLRGCPRGRAQQQMCFGADRIKYPMKRKSWQPGGGENANGHLRGTDEWEQISWDEAIDLLSTEVKRIYADYGPRAVLANGGPGIEQVLCELGGSIQVTDTSSCGTYSFDVTKFGMPPADLGSANDRFDLKNAETIVLMGGNSVWSSGGSTMYNFKQAQDAGTQFVMVSPSYNATAAHLDARWIPVYPGTDTAFLLAVSYEMIQQDVVDTDFLAKYAIGFDADTMPEGAKLDENFKGYLLGTYDGTPKTAEWASLICGTPADDIKWFAGAIGKDQRVMLLHNYAFARCMNAEDIPQLFMTVGAMGGHMGKPGHACGGAYKTYAGSTGDTLVTVGDSGGVSAENPIAEYIAAPVLWKSIAEGSYNNAAIYYGGVFNPEDIRDIDIKYVSFEGNAKLQTSPDILKGIEVLRTMDLVTCSAHFFNNQAQYADIVLPVTTEWERVGGFPGHQRSRESVIVYTQVTEPLYEAKTDQEIGSLFAEAVGVDAKKIWPLSEKQQFFNMILGCEVMDGTSKKLNPLVTVTEDDISSWECEGAPQKGVIELATFLENGCYSVQRSEDDDYGFIGYKDFIDDPEKNPLKSESGKFEIYCDWKADTLNSMGYSPDGTFKPYPSYTIPPAGREASFVDSQVGGTPSEHPFIVYNPHYLRRSHSVFDNLLWLRETWPNPVFVNTADAAAKGIETGDTVRIWNEYGATLRTASLTETLMPGCVALPHGAWLDYDEKLGLDKAGTDSVLCGTAISGMGVSGYNNHNCNYELYDGEVLIADSELPQRIVETN